jgi:hypothetical protein
MAEKTQKISMRFAHERDTKGAVRFQEVDEDNSPVAPESMKIGTLYMRKTAFKDGKFPKALKIDVEF